MKSCHAQVCDILFTCPCLRNLCLPRHTEPDSCLLMSAPQPLLGCVCVSQCERSRWRRFSSCAVSPNCTSVDVHPPSTEEKMRYEARGVPTASGHPWPGSPGPHTAPHQHQLPLSLSPLSLSRKGFCLPFSSQLCTVIPAQACVPQLVKCSFLPQSPLSRADCLPSCQHPLRWGR